MDNENSMFLEIQTKENGILSFKTVENAQSWLNNELQPWAEIYQNLRNDQRFTQYYKTFINHESAIKSGLENSSNKSFQSEIEDIKNKIRYLYDSKYIYRGTDPIGKYIFEEPSESAQEKIVKLFYFNGWSVNLESNKEIAAIVDAKIFKKDFKKYFEYEKSTIEAIKNEIDQTLAALKKDDNEYRQELSDLVEENKNALKGNSESHKKQITKQEVDFQSLITESKKILEEIRNVYDKELALLAPVQYWNKKKLQHNIVAGSMAILLVISAILGIYLLKSELNSLLLLKSELDSHLPDVSNVKNISKLKIGTLFFWVVLFVWLIRIEVRIFLSNLHLATNASEKTTMTNTYLSLLRDKSVSNEVDRRIILESLFRPSSSGLIKDDGVPPSVLGALTKMSK